MISSSSDGCLWLPKAQPGEDLLEQMNSRPFELAPAGPAANQTGLYAF